MPDKEEDSAGVGDPSAHPADPPAAAAGGAAPPDQQSIEANFQRIADASAQLASNGWSYVGPIYRCSTCGYLSSKGEHKDGDVKGCNRRRGVLASPENLGLLFADSKAQADEAEKLVYILSNEKRRDEQRADAAHDVAIDDLNKKISDIESQLAICSGIRDTMIANAKESRAIAVSCFHQIDEVIGA